MKSKLVKVLGSIVLVLVLSVAGQGCGKKGPPLPPENKTGRINAPGSLTSQLNEDIVTLSWTHSANSKAALEPIGFDILVAKKAPGACEGCPFRFNKAGSTAVKVKTFDVKVEKGYQYYFRVQAVGPDDVKSPYSETIQVDIPAN